MTNYGMNLESGQHGISGSPLGMKVERGQESWQFFAFMFGALLAIALAFIEEMPTGRWRIAVKITVSLVIAYFTLLSPRGRNVLVGVLHRFKTLKSR